MIAGVQQDLNQPEKISLKMGDYTQNGGESRSKIYKKKGKNKYNDRYTIQTVSKSNIEKREQAIFFSESEGELRFLGIINNNKNYLYIKTRIMGCKAKKKKKTQKKAMHFSNVQANKSIYFLTLLSHESPADLS
jgi:hypothetical protein